MLVISGLPGTGKSAVAGALAGRLDAVHLSIDPIEDALLGSGLPASWQTGVGAYEAVRAMAGQNLALGRTVVVDAVNDSRPARDTWRRAAAPSGARVLFVLLSLDDQDEHRRRLTGRVRDLAHLPEPSWDEVRDRAAAYEPWPEVDLCCDASAPVDRTVEAVLASL